MKSSLLLASLLLSVVTANKTRTSPFIEGLHMFFPKNHFKHSRKVFKSTTTQMPKLLPIQTDCFSSLPGTQAWNDCMKKFQEDMAENSRRIEEMSAVAAKTPQYHYSCRSTSNSILGGYSIHTENIPSSSVVTNGTIKINLLVNIRHDKIQPDIKTVNRTFIINGVHDGQEIFAEIRLPETVNVEQIKLSRAEEKIVISGPIPNGTAESVQMSQTGGGLSWSASNPASFR